MRSEEALGLDAAVGPHARLDVERTAASERHRPDDHLASVQLDEAHGCVLAERYVVADVEKVPAAVLQIDATVDVNALADFRSKRAQRHLLILGPLQQPPRDLRRGALHHPM